MENKLYQTAGALPETTLAFESIRNNTVSKVRKCVPGILKFAIAVILIVSISITGLAYAKTNYSMWVGLDIRTLQGIKWATDYTLPARLGGIGFWSANKLYLVHEGTSQLESALHPLYVVWEANYGKAVTGEGEQAGMEQQIYYTVYVSTMDDELWRHFIGFTEDDIWSPATLNQSSYYTVDYNGLTLQLGTTGESERCHVYWVDYGREVCIGICSSEVNSLTTLEEIAKEIIDLNT